MRDCTIEKYYIIFQYRIGVIIITLLLQQIYSSKQKNLQKELLMNLVIDWLNY